MTYSICGSICEEACDEGILTIEISEDITPVDCDIHNILTPNGDGYNDLFLIPCLDDFPEHEVYVFNRWGDQVYFSDNYMQDWAGDYNGSPLSPGTYFYLINIKGLNAQSLQGYITIIR